MVRNPAAGTAAAIQPIGVGSAWMTCAARDSRTAQTRTVAGTARAWWCAAAAPDLQAGGDRHEFQDDGVGPGEPAALAVGGGEVVDVGERGGTGRDPDREHDQDLDDPFGPSLPARPGAAGGVVSGRLVVGHLRDVGIVVAGGAGAWWSLSLGRSAQGLAGAVAAVEPPHRACAGPSPAQVGVVGGGGGDREVGVAVVVGETLVQVPFPPRGGQREQDRPPPVGVAGQDPVAGDFGDQDVEGFGAGVVLEVERHRPAALGPDAVAVRADVRPGEGHARHRRRAGRTRPAAGTATPATTGPRWRRGGCGRGRRGR